MQKKKNWWKFVISPSNSLYWVGGKGGEQRRGKCLIRLVQCAGFWMCGWHRYWVLSNQSGFQLSTWPAAVSLATLSQLLRHTWDLGHLAIGWWFVMFHDGAGSLKQSWLWGLAVLSGKVPATLLLSSLLSSLKIYCWAFGGYFLFLFSFFFPWCMLSCSLLS